MAVFRGFVDIRQAELLGRATSTARVRPPPWADALQRIKFLRCLMYSEP